MTYVGPVEFSYKEAYHARQADLRSLCLVSRRLRSIAQPLLANVVFLSDRACYQKIWYKLEAEKKKQIKVLVIDNPPSTCGRNPLPRGVLDQAHSLSQLTVDYDHPFFWITPGSLQHLRFLRVTLALWVPDDCAWAPLLPSLEALSMVPRGHYVLEDEDWPQLFPSLRVLETDASPQPGSTLLDQLELFQHPFFPDENLESAGNLAKMRPHGRKVMPVALAGEGDPDEVRIVAQAVVAWDGLPIAIRYDSIIGIHDFVLGLVQALEKLKPFPETFKTLYLPSHALSPRGSLAKTEVALDSLTLDGVEIVFEDCPSDDYRDPFSWTRVLRERVQRRRLKEQERVQGSQNQSSN